MTVKPETTYMMKKHMSSGGMANMARMVRRDDLSSILFVYPGENGKPQVHEIDQDTMVILLSWYRKLREERYPTYIRQNLRQYPLTVGWHNIDIT